MKQITNISALHIALICIGMSFFASNAVYSFDHRGLSTFSPSDRQKEMARDTATTMLQGHLKKLRNIKSNGFSFKSDFLSPNPNVPCDYCAQHTNVPLDQYVTDLAYKFENPDMKYAIDYDNVRVEDIQEGYYLVTFTVNMIVTGIVENDNTVNKKRRKTTSLVYTYSINYNDRIFGIMTLSAVKNAGDNIWVLELNPNVQISNPDFSSQQVYSPTSSQAFLTKVGVVRYFAPKKGVNAGNIWYKAGLRVGVINSKYQSDFIDYTDKGIELDGSKVDNPHEIDVIHSLNDVVEKQTSFLLEVPLGFSKRVRLNNKLELSLEIEGSLTYTFLILNKGSFTLDQLGTNHLLNRDIQAQSGGVPVLYDHARQVVLTSEGDLIDFYTNRAEVMEMDNTGGSLGYNFSFRPSLMVKPFEKIKYNVGLNISYSGLNNDLHQIDYSYFNSARTDEVIPLHNIDEASARWYIGVYFGLILN